MEIVMERLGSLRSDPVASKPPATDALIEGLDEARLQALADRFHTPYEHVRTLYVDKLNSLRHGARVTSYLTMLSEKHVLHTLKHEGFGKRT
jgi:hypothetical protein